MIRISHVSDTHLQPFNPEPADILIHSGDALNYGSLAELGKFRSQLEAIYKNFEHILFVPGNHERIFEENYDLAQDFLYETIPNLLVLHNQSEVLYNLKFYGTADQPAFCNWAFNRSRGQLIESYAKIPLDTNILITHCPAKGIKDIVYEESVGSPELAAILPKLKDLKLHAFGHIHYSHGLDKIGDTWYSNGAMVDESYQPGYKENIVELP